MTDTSANHTNPPPRRRHVCADLFSFSKYVCAHCDVEYPDKGSLIVHIKVMHGTLVYANPDLVWYACTDCEKLYARKQDIIKHMRCVHSDDTELVDRFVVQCLRDITFPCDQCGQFLLLSRQCAKHRLRAHKKASVTAAVRTLSASGVIARKRPPPKEYDRTIPVDCKKHEVQFVGCHKCRICATNFDDCCELWTHVFSAHKVDYYECNLCANFEAKKGIGMITHMRRIHKKVIHAERTTSLREESSILIDGVVHFKCTHCAQVFWSYIKLRNHVLQDHSGIDLHKCGQCTRVYPNEKKLETHVKRVHEASQPDYQCPHCGRFFNEKSNFQRHLTIHTGERKFVCELCGASFNQWSSLYTHKFSHTDTRYTCSVCSKNFNTPKSLGVHFKAHFDTNVYVCDTCGKQFSSRCVWRGHIKIHNSDRSFVCNICNASFVVKKYLTQHYKTHKGKS